MDRTPFAFAAFALGALVVLSSPACKDNSTVNEEPPLPGPGPIGMGGFTSSTGGSSAGGTAGAGGGTAGAGGDATMAGGMAGTAGTGAGGSTGGTSGTGGAGGGMGGMGAGGSAAVCPATGAGKLRVGNLVPAAGNVDFCIKGATGAFQGPVFSCAGGGAGLAYKALSKQLGVAPGTYDIKAVSGGDCSSAGIATAMGVVVDDKQTVTVLAFGGGMTGEAGKVAAFKNDAPPTDMSINFRFVNGIHKTGSALDVGLTDMGSLPTDINTVVFKSVSFGAASPANPGALFPIDAQGYAQTLVELQGQFVGAAKAGTTPAIFATTTDISPANASITAYGFGIVGDTMFPPGAILCNDGVDAGMLNSCKML